MELLSFAVVFLVVAIVAGILGFGGIQHSAVEIAKILFLVFIVLFLIAVIRGF